jgi:hypothetical protein
VQGPRRPTPYTFIHAFKRYAGYVTHIGEKAECMQDFCLKAGSKEISRKLDVGTAIIFKMDCREIGCGVLDRICLAQNGEQWRAYLNTTINIRVP